MRVTVLLVVVAVTRREDAAHFFSLRAFVQRFPAGGRGIASAAAFG
jgi:hypothetical protein